MGQPTCDVLVDLNTTYDRLYSLVRKGRIPEPPRFGKRGAWIWSRELIEAARQALTEQQGEARE